MILEHSLENIQKLADAIKKGKIVSLPTDTLYALSADARNDDAVREIYAIKGREFDVSLPIFVSDMDSAKKYGEFEGAAIKLANKFWPGPLTLVVPLKDGNDLSPLVYRKKTSVAMRVANHSTISKVLELVDCPLVATSANISKTPSKSTAEGVFEDFKDMIEFILDNSEKCGEHPSTIVECTGDEIKIARKGAISEKEIYKALK